MRARIVECWTSLRRFRWPGGRFRPGFFVCIFIAFMSANARRSQQCATASRRRSRGRGARRGKRDTLLYYTHSMYMFFTTHIVWVYIHDITHNTVYTVTGPGIYDKNLNTQPHTHTSIGYVWSIEMLRCCSYRAVIPEAFKTRPRLHDRSINSRSIN